MERTALDDDTRDHLVEWVDEGGVLVLVGSPYAWPKAFGAASADLADASAWLAAPPPGDSSP